MLRACKYALQHLLVLFLTAWAQARDFTEVTAVRGRHRQALCRHCAEDMALQRTAGEHADSPKEPAVSKRTLNHISLICTCTADVRLMQWLKPRRRKERRGSRRAAQTVQEQRRRLVWRVANVGWSFPFHSLCRDMPIPWIVWVAEQRPCVCRCSSTVWICEMWRATAGGALPDQRETLGPRTLFLASSRVPRLSRPPCVQDK